MTKATTTTRARGRGPTKAPRLDAARLTALAILAERSDAGETLTPAERAMLAEVARIPAGLGAELRARIASPKTSPEERAEASRSWSALQALASTKATRAART